jgi:uncharacterized protein involved in exopolysaccharide biosynthesis
MMLAKINEDYREKKIDYEKLTDSIQKSTNGSTAELMTAQRSSLLQQVQEDEKLLNQYNLMVNARPQALIIIEKATPALAPDRPKPLEAIIAATILSFFFGLLTALILNKRKSATV